MSAHALLLGAVAYDPKVVTIWAGFRDWFAARDLPVDVVLFLDYDRQVADLVAGRIDLAWNSPLAWLQAVRAGAEVRAVAMRDTDRDLTSVTVVRADSDVRVAGDLRGRTVAVGAVDSPQATLLPLSFLRRAGLEPGGDLAVRRFDVGVGLHGDHIGGERDAARALLAGEVDAACMLDANHLLFAREGTLPAGATRLIGRTDPYDHCNMTASATAPADAVDRFAELLLSMSYEDPEVRPLLDLEGLTAWLPGRTTGYRALAQALDEEGPIRVDGRAADGSPAR